MTTFLKSKIIFWFLLFLFSFILNLAWEEFHSVLYLNYQGGIITHFILIRASLADAIFISVLFSLTKVIKKIWLFPVLAILLAFLIEKWALGAGRWAYNSLMPVLPILRVGLSPFIQLAVTGIISQKITVLGCRFLKAGVIG